MIKWKDYRDGKLQETEFRQAYDDLEVEYSIRNEIIKARKELEMSQLQLSNLTGITQPDISKLENRKANPSIATLKKLATALGKKLRIQFV